MTSLMKNENKKKLIELENIHVDLKSAFETINVLKGINLKIFKNESVGIIGESGAGKSTLVMCIAGLELISKGKIFFKNSPIHNLNEDDLAIYRSKNIGVIFQAFNLLPSMTALENVNLPIEIAGSFKNNKMAIELLTAVGLKNRIFHYPHQLSGGEQQRVAIARSLISNPEILIADEPTGNLDKKNSEDVIKLLFKLKKDFGSTLILVTHDTSVAKLCDRIIKIDNGLIVE
ncbi:MAG: ABC transporter ATP-binding protein [Alphaproteobacteria bacterium]|nr:MAG: ABC transporter ATP-binding protein [Alphaproteobacteria bacterium]